MVHQRLRQQHEQGQVANVHGGMESRTTPLAKQNNRECQLNYLKYKLPGWQKGERGATALK